MFDAIPLRIIPTIIVSTMYVLSAYACIGNMANLRCFRTYWMAWLAHDAAHYFKFLLILVLYTLLMTLFVCPLSFALSLSSSYF